MSEAAKTEKHSVLLLTLLRLLEHVQFIDHPQSFHQMISFRSDRIVYEDRLPDCECVQFEHLHNIVNVMSIVSDRSHKYAQQIHFCQSLMFYAYHGFINIAH